jgi:hypothetical protein
MWPWIAVEGALQITARMMFKMLEMGDHSVVGGLMRADPAMAYRATLDPVWMQLEGVLERDRLPALKDS